MYLNVIQLAESLGVPENVLEEWVRNEGLPCIHDRGRLLFDRVQVVAWAATRGLAAKAGFLAPERSTSSPARRLELLLRAGGIWREVATSGVSEILERVVTDVTGATPAVRQLLVQRLRSPDGITWAPVGHGLALPHLRTPVALGRDAGTVALLMLNDPLPLKEPPPDNIPVTRLLFFIAPSPRAHLEMLALFSTALTRRDLRQLILDAAPDEQILAALATVETASAAGANRETKA
jgi:PTS system nitrogen regulatory IIA component